MKKVLCIVFSLFLVIGCFSGCSENAPDGDSADESVNVEMNDNETNIKETEKKDDFKVGFNTETYRVPLTDIYIDIPSSPYHVIEMAYVKASMIYDEQCISVIYNDESDSDDLATNHNQLIDLFKLCVDSQFNIENLNVLSEETVTINGTEMYHFEGELVCYYETIINGQTNKTTYTQYCVGYTFIKDDMPCSLIGTVLNKNKVQPESVEKDVEEKVDTLIKTLRSEP